jgi:SPP1 gp7 family putative phage head morphogenesis protein
MSKFERYFDTLLHEYYMVLINAWDESVKRAARNAIDKLIALGKNERVNDTIVKDMEFVIRQELGPAFAAALDSKVKTFSEICYKLSAQEPQFKDFKLRFGPSDERAVQMIKRQNVFWLKKHFDGNISERLQEILQSSVERGLTTRQLASELRTEFGSLVKGSQSYFEGLAEHTGLRVREFSRLTNYKRLGATHYQIVAVIDDRTSDICRALDGKIYPLDKALGMMEKMFEVNENWSAEDAKAHLREVAPFVRADQIERDSDNQPIIVGEHVGFPPFHWRCRTRTIMIYGGVE